MIYFSISSSVIPVEYGGHKINIIDVPGYFDFIGDAYAALRVADAAVIVVDALSGVQVGTEKALELLEKADIPAFIVVNKGDRDNADFGKVLDSLKDLLGNKVIPFELPMGEGEQMRGVVNIVDMTGSERRDNRCFDTTVPDEMKEDLAPYREMIMESVAQTSEDLMDKYFSGEELSSEEIHQGIRSGVLDRELLPVLCTSASQNIGVETLENMIIEYMPSPEDSKPAVGRDPRDQKEIERSATEEEPFSALIFKTVVDPYVGKLSFIRVFSGTLPAEGNIFNVNRGEDERISSFRAVTGKEGKDMKEITVGDIIAIPKLQSTHAGDTLSLKGSSVVYPPIQFPKPVYSLAVVAKSRADEDKLANAIHKVLEEDSSLSFEKNPETGDSVLSGMGDMHLDIVLSRIKERYGVELETKTPQVPYRETIRKVAEAQGKHKKQTGGHGQYGDVHVRFCPLERGAGFEFKDEVTGGTVPRQFIPAVEKGLREALTKGPLASFPVVDFSAALFYGSYHDVDSSEMSFKLAARLAFKKGIMEANPVLLEPIMTVEVSVPEEYLGDVMGDFNSRRGRILGIDSKGHLQVVRAQVPLAEMFRYAIILRSMTSGRGTFTMAYDHYEDVPAEISKKVIAAHKQEDEEE